MRTSLPKNGSVGKIIDGSIAYIDLNGGRPHKKCTHGHNHLFIVTRGEAKIMLGNDEIMIKKR